MAGGEQADYYEILQVSSNADTETISRVFRFLAKRFHPDGPDGGDPDRFSLITEAFKVLSDPERRADYDARHERIREDRWRILNPDPGANDITSDNRIRATILSLLYASRRQDVDKPGMGIYELERLLAVPSEHMKFHIWYLREQGWIARTEDGQYAITVDGVDRVTREGPDSLGPLMLSRGDVQAVDAEAEAEAAK